MSIYGKGASLCDDCNQNINSYRIGHIAKAHKLLCYKPKAALLDWVKNQKPVVGVATAIAKLVIRQPASLAKSEA